MSRHVIVTGASRGIGAAIATRFLADGHTVVGWSRSGDAPDGVAHKAAVDVADSAAVDAAAKEAIGLFGPIDTLVVNAGITRDGLAMRMNDEQWHDVMRTNLDGAFFCARSAVSSMIRARRVSIIFIGSVSPFMGVPGQANYAASKAGLLGLARSLAAEVASRGITVNVVAPGLIETDMTADLGTAADTMTAMIPMGRAGQPNDVAGVVSFLASEDARYVTGALLCVDGGLALGW
jgi:NAD(P)-dependent dehydrogenase (short-subunit alcohol dehydrogenase family)